MTIHKPKLILIADAKSSDCRTLVQRVEFETNYDTMVAADSPEALAQAERRRPDAAILDMDAPRLDGFEAARCLRDRFGERRPLLIALTDNDEDALNFSGLFDHVMKKPIHMGDLLPKLAQS